MKLIQSQERAPGIIIIPPCQPTSSRAFCGPNIGDCVAFAAIIVS